MAEVLEELKNNHILYHQNVIDLKQAICKKYPNHSTKQTAAIFAAAIHKILDKHMMQFDEKNRHIIKNKLLQDILKKNVFDINAHDVLTACLTLEYADEHYFDKLTRWVNDNQGNYFSKEEIYGLSLGLKAPHETLINAQPFEDTFVEVKFKEPILNTLAFLKHHKTLFQLIGGITISLLIIFQGVYLERYKKPEPEEKQMMTVTSKPVLTEADSVLEERVKHPPMKKKLYYKEIDEEALSDWLQERDSMLAQEPYFDSIVEAAKAYNINPLLMFAITGQEQAFVPKSHSKASSIANNPFNVYGSWENFNTDIEDTSKIAAKTIVNLSKDCPEDEDPVKWINKKYAEDPNWHKGVSQILEVLEETAGKQNKDTALSP